MATPNDTTNGLVAVFCVLPFLLWGFVILMRGGKPIFPRPIVDPPFERREFEKPTSHKIEEARKQRAVDYWANEWEMKKRGENHRE